MDDASSLNTDVGSKISKGGSVTTSQGSKEGPAASQGSKTSSGTSKRSGQVTDSSSGSGSVDVSSDSSPYVDPVTAILNVGAIDETKPDLQGPTVIAEEFGTIMDTESGREGIVWLYTLVNKAGLTVQIISRGAAVVYVKMPDRRKRTADVVLGFDDLVGYAYNKDQYFGAILGRVANRISGAQFFIEDQQYDVSKNDGDHCLNGGELGLDQCLWESYVDDQRVVFSYDSADGRGGFPGSVLVQVAYSLREDNSLVCEMKGLSTKPTPLTLASHVCFNLAGHSSGPSTLREHVFCLNADKYLATNPDLIPTGEILPVGGTVYDLRVPRALGDVLEQVPEGCYDITYCINGGPNDGVRFAARVYHPFTGRILEVFSDQPAMQLNTGCQLPDVPPPPPEPLEELGPEQVAKCFPEDGSIQQAESPQGSTIQQEGAEKAGLLKVSGGSEQSPASTRSKETTGSKTSPLGGSKHSDGSKNSSTGSKQSAGSKISASKQSTQSKTSSPSKGSSEIKGSNASQDSGPPKSSSTSGGSGDTTSSDSTEIVTPPPPPEPLQAKGGAGYCKVGCFSFAMHNYPDSVHQDHFPNCILFPGKQYKQTVIYRFSVGKF